MPIVPIDHSRMELLANYLQRCPAAENFYAQKDLAWGGFLGSQAEREHRYPGPHPTRYSWRPNVMNTAFAAARLLLGAASEQVLALARLITDPTTGYHGVLGPESCARSAIEICAKVYWLMDPAISARERACRYFIEQLHSAHASETLAREMNWSGSVDALGLGPTSDRIRSVCRELGLPPGGNARHPSVGGQQRPSATDLISTLVAGTPYRDNRYMVYRVLSASNHGTVYGLMRSFVVSDETFENQMMLDMLADHRIIEASVGVTLMSFVVVLQRVVAIMGWDHWKATTLGNMFHSILVTGPR